MNYKIKIRRGQFNLLNPNVMKINHWIAIYDKDSKKPCKVLNVDTDDGEYLFSENAEPIEIADGLETYLNSLCFTTQREEIKDMIKFLKEHSEELLKSKLEKELKDLEKRKEEIIKRLNNL